MSTRFVFERTRSKNAAVVTARSQAEPGSPRAFEEAEHTSLYRPIAFVSRPLVRILFRPVVHGLELLPAEGGFVLSSNQLSNLDGWALAYALQPRQPRWMGKAELFKPVLAPFVRGMGIFPVRRGEGDRGAIETAVRLARAGCVVGIFPEGTRRRKGLRKRSVARPHSGAARVALEAGVPLVPAAIRGTECLTRLRQWHIRFGSPISLDDLPERREAREATARLWSTICALEDELWSP